MFKRQVYKGIPIEVRTFNTYARIIVADNWTKIVTSPRQLVLVLQSVKRHIDIAVYNKGVNQ